jgi:PBSX family phage terminase large subunit
MTECADFEVAANYQFIDQNFSWKKSQAQQKQIFVLEGGSGSAKTWDIIQFLIIYCDNYYGWNKDILIGRATYADVRDTVLKDFIKVLKLRGIYSKKNHQESHPQKYTLYGNMISFDGLNGIGSHGERHDIVWINEVMETDWEDVKQLNQRCNEVLLCDYNPVYTDHWLYDRIIPRPDCRFFKSTQLNNPFLPEGQRMEILAYEPTHPADRHLPKEKRRPHPTNIANGTADDYSWEVYGLGNRANMRGLVFPYVTYIKEFPMLAYTYGMDFGFTADPTAIVKSAEDDSNIYIELLSYEPIETPQEIHMYAIKRGMNVSIPTTADSSDKFVSQHKGAIEMVSGLRKLGWKIQKVSKTQSVMFWLQSMKKKKIHVVENDLVHYARKEFQNYHYREINGITINQPIDEYNHCIDAARYRHMAFNRTRKAFA